MAAELAKAKLDKLENWGAERQAEPGGLCWVRVPEGRNMDELPDELTPRRGCARCGSVWVDYVAVAFLPNMLETFVDASGVLRGRSGQLYVLGGCSEFVVPVAAVRARCHEGHEELCAAPPSRPSWWKHAAQFAVGAWAYSVAKWGHK